LETVRLRKRYLPLAALLGAAVAVLPNVASSSPTATVNAVSAGIYPYWSPSQAAITPGGTVTFDNASSTVTHGIIWQSTPATPTCDSSVPVGVNNFAPSWSGSCTFTQSGTYTYYCSYHGPSMSGTIYVNDAGTVPVITTPPPTTTVPTTTTPPPTDTTPPPPSTTQTQPASSTPTDTAVGSSAQVTSSTASTDAGTGTAALSAPLLTLAKTQHGAVVRGSARIASASAGARLEIDLLTGGVTQARGGHSAAVQVGRLVRSSATAGKLSFSVSLSAKGKHALALHGRLTVTVRITITRAGKTKTATHSIVLLRH
jgi:plastocyanin